MKFYRYEAYSSLAGASLELRTFKLVKETPSGYWIDNDEGLFNYSQILVKPKWVSKYARKRFCCVTKLEALESFIARKSRQILILQEQLNTALVGKLLAEELKAQIESNEKGERR